MNQLVKHQEELEKDRQEYINDVRDPEDDWEGMSKPGSFGCHELLDRTALIMKTVEEFIVSHPACLNNKEWFALARQASEALHELYQQIGAEHLEKTADHKQLTTDQ
jgi:hypothetical protein